MKNVKDIGERSLSEFIIGILGAAAYLAIGIMIGKMI